MPHKMSKYLEILWIVNCVYLPEGTVSGNFLIIDIESSVSKLNGNEILLPICSLRLNLQTRFFIREC